VDARFGGWSAAAGLRGGRWAAPPPEGTPDHRRRARQNPSAAGVGQEQEEARVGSESDRGVGGKENRRGMPISGGIAGNFCETSALTAGKSTPRVAVENELQKSCFCGSRGLEAHPFGLLLIICTKAESYPCPYCFPHAHDQMFFPLAFKRKDSWPFLL